MANKISGRIYFISEKYGITSQKTGNTIYKRELWIQPFYYDRYTGEANSPSDKEMIKFEFGNDRCDLLDVFSVGNDVTVSFALSGSTYTDTATNTMKCITRVEGLSVSLASVKFREEPQQEQQVQQQFTQQQPQQSSLPFGQG